ncbi:hypothetical protein B0H13DRAFT_2689685 [Mycena leptocephala]|nr:hypothetical protein B0H13DRAFT_2689685 [Mycena leptocephala]
MERKPQGLPLRLLHLPPHHPPALYHTLVLHSPYQSAAFQSCAHAFLAYRGQFVCAGCARPQSFEARDVPQIACPTRAAGCASRRSYCALSSDPCALHLTTALAAAPALTTLRMPHTLWACVLLSRPTLPSCLGDDLVSGCIRFAIYFDRLRLVDSSCRTGTSHASKYAPCRAPRMSSLILPLPPFLLPHTGSPFSLPLRARANPHIPLCCDPRPWLPLRGPADDAPHAAASTCFRCTPLSALATATSTTAACPFASGSTLSAATAAPRAPSMAFSSVSSYARKNPIALLAAACPYVHFNWSWGGRRCWQDRWEAARESGGAVYGEEGMTYGYFQDTRIRHRALPSEPHLLAFYPSRVHAARYVFAASQSTTPRATTSRHTIASHAAYTPQHLLSLALPRALSSSASQPQSSLRLSDLSPGLNLVSLKTRLLSSAEDSSLNDFNTTTHQQDCSRSFALFPNNSSSAVVVPVSPHPRPTPFSHSSSNTLSKKQTRPLLVSCTFHRVALPLVYYTLILRSPCRSSDPVRARLPRAFYAVEVLDVTLPDADVNAVEDLAAAIQRLRGLRALTIRKGVGTYPCSMRLRTQSLRFPSSTPRLTSPLSADPALSTFTTALAVASCTHELRGPPLVVAVTLLSGISVWGRPRLSGSCSYFDFDCMRTQGCGRGSLSSSTSTPPSPLPPPPLHPAPEYRASSHSSLSLIASPNAPSSPPVSSSLLRAARVPERADWGRDGRCWRWKGEVERRERDKIRDDTANTYKYSHPTKNLSPRRYNDNHHRLPGSATPTPTTARLLNIRARCLHLDLRTFHITAALAHHRLAHNAGHTTIAPALSRLIPLPLLPFQASLSLSTSPSLQSLCYRDRLHSDLDSYGPKFK